jgi:hypothetical protein
MSTRHKLTRQQLAVIDDLFCGKQDEPAILRRHNVSRTRYEQWLEDDRFVAEFEKRIGRAYQQTRLLLARNARAAADKLVALTQGKGGETTRKACLDIITFRPPDHAPAAQRPQTQQATAAETTDLSPETASRLLAALAEESQAEHANP